jgi:hypothetical protein
MQSEEINAEREARERVEQTTLADENEHKLKLL